MEGGDLVRAHVRRLHDPAAVARAHACKHLAQLASKGDQTRASIREAGAIEGLLPLLHGASTQVEAAGAIAALAVDADARALVRSAGGCAPLVQALQSKTIAAREEAARALGHLARDEECRIEIADLGGIVALVKLVQENDRDMQLAAAGALNQLARNAENRVTIVGTDGHDAMIEILRDGETPAPPDLQAEAAGTLAQLAFYGPNKRKIREAGGLERLIGVLGSSSTEVADAAAAALSRLTKNDAECQAAVSAADGMRQLAALLWSECESTRQYSRAAIENLGAHPEEEKAAWAKAKADERTGAVAKADQLREKADESLLVGELDAAAATYTEALALHPHSTLLHRRLARTERERVSASSSIERLAARTTSVRQTRRKLASKAPDPLKLAGMPDGVLSLIEQFRAVDSRRRRDGIAAHLAPSFTSSRQQLDEAAAQLDSAQSALYRRSVESTPAEILPPTSSSASRLGNTAGDGYTAFAVGKETTLLPPDVKQLIQRRDDARRSFVQSADTFLSRVRSETFQESHEGAVHVIGPLQQAADQLGSVPMLGPTSLGEEAEALHEVEQGINDDDHRGSNRHISDRSRPSEGGKEKTKKYAPEAAALAAFDSWIADNTAATVGTKTEEAIARLLSCVSENLAPRTPTSAQVQTDQTDNIGANASTSQQELLEAVREADARLATEQRYWQLADPIRSLPVGVIRRSAGALLHELTSKIEEVEAIYSYAELIEERRDEAMKWIEREDQGEPVGVTELVEYSDLARACAEEMEEVTVAITSLRNEPEQTRDNRRLQEMESKAKALRRRRYEAEKGLKAERKRLCQLAAEHYPELPLRFPGAGLRLDPQMGHSSQLGQSAEEDKAHSKNAGKGGAANATSQLQDQEAVAEATAVTLELSDPKSAAHGLGDALETEAEALAKMRRRLVDAERRLEHQWTAAAKQQDISEGQAMALESEEASLQRQRRELLRRQRAFSLKCELAGRSAELVALPAAWTASMLEGTASLSDFLGGRTSSAAIPQSEPEPEPEPEPGYDIGPTVAGPRTGGYSSAMRPPRSARRTSPERIMSSAPHSPTSPIPVSSDIERLSESVSVSVSSATRAASPTVTAAAATPTRSANGRYVSGASSEVRSFLSKREVSVEVEADIGEEALDGERNSTMKAAAQRAEQRLRLRPESDSSNRTEGAQQALNGTNTAFAVDIGAQPKQLTRLERARQQASARISTGDKLIAAGGSTAEERQQLRTRSPSPPRTLSARMSAAQQEQARTRGAGSSFTYGRGSPTASSPAFRQPRTASELNAAPTPPPMSPFRGSGDQQPNYTGSNQANAPADGLSKTITSRVRETMGIPDSVASATPYGTSSHATETVLEAMDKDDDGAVSRNEYASYPRSVQATMAYAQYTAGMYHCP